MTCPPSPTLEDQFYPNERTIAATARRMVTGANETWLPDERVDLRAIDFKGPF